MRTSETAQAHIRSTHRLRLSDAEVRIGTPPAWQRSTPVREAHRQNEALEFLSPKAHQEVGVDKLNSARRPACGSGLRPVSSWSGLVARSLFVLRLGRGE